MHHDTAAGRVPTKSLPQQIDLRAVGNPLASPVDYCAQHE
jgi:hypothetical protein